MSDTITVLRPAPHNVLIAKAGIRGPAGQDSVVAATSPVLYDPVGGVVSLLLGPGGVPSLGTGGELALQSGDATIVPLSVMGIAGQSADLQQWKSSVGTVLARVGSGGTLTAPVVYTDNMQARSATGPYLAVDGATVAAVARSATQVPMAVKAFAAQTADLQQWQNSAATVLARVLSSGGMALSTTATGDSFAITSNNVPRFSINAASGLTTINPDVFSVVAQDAALRVGSRQTGTPVAVLRTIALQTADFLQLQNSDGAVIFRVNKEGHVDITDNAVGGNPTVPQVRVRGNSGQTSDVIQWGEYFGQTYVRTGGVAGHGGLLISPTNATPTPLTIFKGGASQAQDLAQWQSSAGAVLARVTAAGRLTGTSVAGFLDFNPVPVGSGPDVALTASDRLVLTAATEVRVASPRIQATGSFMINSGTALTAQAGTINLQTNVANTVIFTGGFNLNTVLRPYSAAHSVVTQGIAAQTADLHQWQSSAGTVLSKNTANGEYEQTQSGAGIYMRSPNGTRFKLTISDLGMPVVTAAP